MSCCTVGNGTFGLGLLCTVGNFQTFLQMGVTFLPFDGNGWNLVREHLGPFLSVESECMLFKPKMKGFGTTLKFSLTEKCSDFDENLRSGWT